MGATQSPFLYDETGHPFTGLPLDIVAQIGNDGDGGMYQMFNHFTEWAGPVADGTLGGVVMTSVNTGRVDLPAQASGVQDSVIRLTADGTDNDNSMLEWRLVPMNYTVGKQMWFFMRFELEDADDAEVHFGLMTTNADFIAGLPADGLFFEKAETATDFDFHVRKDGTSTENTPAGLGLTLADDTFVTLGFHVNAAGTVTPYSISNAGVVTAGTAHLSTDANMPDAAADIMTPHVGIETGDTAETYIGIDWLAVVRER